MRLCLLCCWPLLSACTSDPVWVAFSPSVPADLFQPCPGYLDLPPVNEGQISDALIAEARGRDCANGKLATVAEILNSTGPNGAELNHLNMRPIHATS